jgi:hypothetical protein
MNYGLLKQGLPIVSSGCAGFYLGGRYVGELAQPTYFQSKPLWLIEAQQTLWVVLALTAVTALSWVILDYKTNATQ